MILTPKQTMKGTIAGSQSVRGSMKEIPSLDKTLTKEGYAADAKAVGEKFTKMETSVNNGKTKVVLLWQNASPSSAFEGDQYIDLGEGNTSSVYDCAIVLCRYSAGFGHMAQSDLLKQNFGASVYYPKGYVSEQATRWFRRDGGQNGRYLYVSHGFADGVQNNSYCMPFQVYGIKW